MIAVEIKWKHAIIQVLHLLTYIGIISEIPLNMFEKETKVIELHKQEKTIRRIALEVKMSFQDISKKIKHYDRTQRLETKRENNENNFLKNYST
jgi:hypothetical protein